MGDPQQLVCGEESLARSPAIDVLFLFMFTAWVSLSGLASGPGMGDHETIVALGARGICQSGEWLIPRVGNEEFVRKPPLAFWLTALSSKLVDPPGSQPAVSPLAARLPSALAAIGTVFILYALGRSMFGHRGGWMSAAALASSTAILFFSHNAQVEMVLTFFITAAFACFWFGTEGRRNRRLFLCLFYVSFALAMMAKFPLPLAVLALPLAVWWFVTIPLARLEAKVTPADGQIVGDEASSRRSLLIRQVHRLRELWLWPGLLLFAVLAFAWPVYVYFRVPNVLSLWNIEFIDRYTGDLSVKGRRAWYYVPIALGLMFPYCLSVPEALASGFLNTYRRERKGLLFALTWAIVHIVFISTSVFKRPHYLIACVPALALLLGPVLDRLWFAARTFSRWRLQSGMALVLLILAGGLVGGRVYLSRDFPDAMGSYQVAALLLLAGAIVSCTTFLKGNRALSCGVLLATVGLTFAWSWDTIGQSGLLDRRAADMMKELSARSIGRGDRITWVIGRPDSRLMYDLDIPIGQLYTPLELAPEREGRQTIPLELLKKGMERMRDRLVSQEEEYFIIKGKYWDELRGKLTVEAREVCRIRDEWNDAKGDWVLITNAWNSGEEEDCAALPAPPPDAGGSTRS